MAPLVLVDRTRDGDSHCSVSVDERLGGWLALEHHIELGHTRVAYVGEPDHIGQVRDRREGARQAVAAAGLDADALVDVMTEALTIDQGRHAGGRIAGMPRTSRPTAAFCANDLVALGLLQRCVELGMSGPDDLAVVGYDDIDYAAAAAVPLTSVRQPRRGHACRRRAATLLTMDTRVTRRGAMATDRPERYAKQLAGHWARKGSAGEEDGVTVIRFETGQVVRMWPEPGVLRVESSVAEGGDPNRFAQVVKDHLERFGQREELDVVWDAAPTEAEEL